MLTLPTRADVAGKVSTFEGDTVKVAVELIRLQGIDAPERRRVDTQHADTT
jgi:endonuclease YncB( thermonuclease family)